MREPTGAANKPGALQQPQGRVQPRLLQERNRLQETLVPALPSSQQDGKHQVGQEGSSLEIWFFPGYFKAALGPATAASCFNKWGAPAENRGRRISGHQQGLPCWSKASGFSPRAEDTVSLGAFRAAAAGRERKGELLALFAA